MFRMSEFVRDWERGGEVDKYVYSELVGTERESVCLICNR